MWSSRCVSCSIASLWLVEVAVGVVGAVVPVRDGGPRGAVVEVPEVGGRAPAPEAAGSLILKKKEREKAKGGGVGLVTGEGRDSSRN